MDPRFSGLIQAFGLTVISPISEIEADILNLLERGRGENAYLIQAGDRKIVWSIYPCRDGRRKAKFWLEVYWESMLPDNTEDYKWPSERLGIATAKDVAKVLRTHTV